MCQHLWIRRSWGMVLVLCATVTLAQTPPVSDLTPVSRDAYNAIVQFYQYDSEIPLDAHIVQMKEFTDAIRYKIVFTGESDKPVPGYVQIPRTKTAPYPCILLLHGMTDSKAGWWQPDSYAKGGLLTQRLTELGYAVVALDAVYHGERIAENRYEPPGAIFFTHGWANRTREMILRSTIDYRRVMDYLATRSDIDTSRIGALGYSMGGMMIFLLRAVDSRIKASVACVAPPMSKPFLDLSAVPISQRVRLEAVSPHNFAHAVGAHPFLMMMGRKDVHYTNDQAIAMYQLIPSTVKNLIWYDSGHQLPEDYIADAVSWFQTHLK